MRKYLTPRLTLYNVMSIHYRSMLCRSNGPS
jgi:hypothetical protein